MTALTTILALAWQDYRHEWRLSLCLILGLAAVQAPLLALFGLKFGIVATLTGRLVEDPRNREIVAIGSGRFEPAWFAALAARPDVAFVLPRTRPISATADLRVPDGAGRRPVTVDLIPTAPGDPLIEAWAIEAWTIEAWAIEARAGVPTPPGAVVLTQPAAEKLGIGPGAAIEAGVGRHDGGRLEYARLRLTVGAVLPLAALDRDAAFAPPDLLVAIEDYRDGRAVPRLGAAGSPVPEGPRVFPSYRLYARSIDDVPALRAHLLAQGLEVSTQAEAIETVQGLNRSLTVIFFAIAGIAALGYLASLSASGIANVERKHRELAILRLLGFRTGAIMLFPMAQAVFTGVFGSLAAGVLFGAAQAGLNHLFAAQLLPGESVCRLLPAHAAAAGLITLAGVALASSLGGRRAARIEPAEGLRDV